ncbi:MAG: hypothetical protein IKN94_00925 [Salinivirgaceae bacterium]|nr:hypothetical protein [Salinivirgaceae bacterium]
MNKKDLESKLRKQCSSAKLPTHYDYNVVGKNLTLKVSDSGLKANMQTDDGAFESWALILKFYLSDIIDTVTIDWEDITKKTGHFNRFVYRLAKFVQTYDWAKSAKPIPDIPTILVCNCPNGEAAPKEKHEKGSEGWIECEFVEKEKVNYDIINHQFPVGLFKNTVKKSESFTTRGKSAIDIWAAKDNQFYIFELKKDDNISAGIISELMFYTNVVNDLFSHRIQYESDNAKKAIKENYRGFGDFYKLYNSGTVKTINAVLLAEELHPLITKELISFINNSARYKYNHIVFSTSSPK